MNEWIKCSERLPNPYHFVLVYADKNAINGNGSWSIARWENNSNIWNVLGDGESVAHGDIFWGIDEGEITHWMPLPEPPDENQIMINKMLSDMNQKMIDSLNEGFRKKYPNSYGENNA